MNRFWILVLGTAFLAAGCTPPPAPRSSANITNTTDAGSITTGAGSIITLPGSMTTTPSSTTTF